MSKSNVKQNTASLSSSSENEISKYFYNFFMIIEPKSEVVNPINSEPIQNIQNSITSDYKQKNIINYTASESETKSETSKKLIVIYISLSLLVKIESPKITFENDEKLKVKKGERIIPFYIH